MPVCLIETSASDAPILLEFIHELGDSDNVKSIATNLDLLAKHIYSPIPAAIAKFVEFDGFVCGFVMYSWKWGVFTGVNDMYMHAIYIKPNFRRKGIAKKVMSLLAKIVLEYEGSRIEWLTVRGKEMSTSFYESIGSTEAGHMVVRRLQGNELNALAYDTF